MAKLGAQLIFGEIERISRAAGCCEISLTDQLGERFGCGLNEGFM